MVSSSGQTSAVGVPRVVALAAEQQRDQRARLEEPHAGAHPVAAARAGAEPVGEPLGEPPLDAPAPAPPRPPVANGSSSGVDSSSPRASASRSVRGARWRWSTTARPYAPGADRPGHKPPGDVSRWRGAAARRCSQAGAIAARKKPWWPIRATPRSAGDEPVRLDRRGGVQLLEGAVAGGAEQLVVGEREGGDRQLELGDPASRGRRRRRSSRDAGTSAPTAASRWAARRRGGRVGGPGSSRSPGSPGARWRGRRTAPVADRGLAVAPVAGAGGNQERAVDQVVAHERQRLAAEAVADPGDRDVGRLVDEVLQCARRVAEPAHHVAVLGLHRGPVGHAAVVEGERGEARGRPATRRRRSRTGPGWPWPGR